MNDLMKRFEMKLPLILAPMGGGPSTPALAAAVCNAGGLGSLGCAYLSPELMTQEIQKTRELTKRPFVVNLFVPAEEPVLDEMSLHRALKATKIYRDELELEKPDFKPPYAENFDAQFEAMLREKPAAFSFVFGSLDRKYLEACQREGIYTMGTATTLDEALLLQEAGVEAVIAQGVEAGGHRAIFDAKKEDPQIGVLPLVSLLKDHIRVPIIAAGAIMNGKGIKAAVDLGAQAAQLGTAFLLCEEAGTNKAYRLFLLDTQQRTTHLTRAFSGRIARGIENRFMMEMKDKESAILPFPAQNAFTRDIRGKAAQMRRPEFLSMWAGEGVAQIRTMKAAELVQMLAAEYAEA
ncbi:MAG: nitronate monooxygenase [Bdellovibrionales bacterium]|nr:nitronate monooxygenase [Bdellovibrionales bacterium]